MNDNWQTTVFGLMEPNRVDFNKICRLKPVLNLVGISLEFRIVIFYPSRRSTGSLHCWRNRGLTVGGGSRSLVERHQ